MNAYAQLSVQRSLDRPETAARVALSRRKPQVECPRYFASLKRALWEEYPPFATELYDEMYGSASSSSQWLAMSLITNAQREGERARRLWSLAANSSENPNEQLLLKQHACDESKHALAYLALLDIAFPSVVDPTFRSQLDQFSPGFEMSQELSKENEPPRQPSLDDYVALNIDEIRTTIHHVFQLRAIPKHCSADTLPQATKSLKKLLDDELNHVAYTAEIIESKTKDSPADEVDAHFCRCVSNFIRAKSEEPIEFTYNQRFGNYP
jgi:hypothetical protein